MWRFFWPMGRERVVTVRENSPSLLMLRVWERKLLTMIELGCGVREMRLSVCGGWRLERNVEEFFLVLLSSSWLAWVIFMRLVSMGNSGEGDGHWLTGGWLEWFSEGGWLGFESCSRVVAVGRCCCYDGHSWRKLFGREKKGWGHEAMKLVGVVVTGNKKDEETTVRLLWRKWWRDG